ncbi:MAG: hypothetical protein KC776_42370 [Myxococcales bacterium]|nr:hypothetical protein [Myxococcales bacterium]MCB9575768.1 hypothetical protein [Polyangiaceae bacterium]
MAIAHRVVQLEPKNSPVVSLPSPTTPGNERTTDWGSLVADLSRREEPTFHVHDRTHVEFAIDYRLTAGSSREQYEWQAFFFAPESLRLDSRTYDKNDIYSDLQSYVRFEVPEVEFGALGDDAMDDVKRALADGSAEHAMNELRLYACRVRAAGVNVRRQIFDALSKNTPEHAFDLALGLARNARRVSAELRQTLQGVGERGDPLATAACWVQEDVSRLLEALLAHVGQRLERAQAPRRVVQEVEDAALAEARHRSSQGLGGIGRLGMKRRDIETIEFRRHMLKRFTASVLWLSPEVRPASRWVRELLFAVAASVAMGFAIGAGILNGFQAEPRRWMDWMLIAVVAYAAKDRIKASLQHVFSSVLDRHFPDRRWRIRDRERGVTLGTMKEQSGFIGWDTVPEAVLASRRITREHPLEEQARPETVLFHQKQVTLFADRVVKADPRLSALTEIFRLNLGPWLAHTDDPKRDIVFADPVAGRVGSAQAPRVYNIAVVYRLRRVGDDDAPWHRLRVVVTRKGIRRIENIT